MMIRRISTTFAVLAVYATSLHATTASGVIQFTGLVYQPASAPMVFHASGSQERTWIVQTYPLSEAMNKLHSDVLDYFATYARRNSTVVSATYE
ncbi:hypothetical protein [Dyella psychrodurans]|uniref:Uncharacterized protein n=1 Tax=Dyella psychrodurans TaxID=1927960 RepID=A0A370XDH5_9GAMM|nr:hypothetical protein [Dyella psychrodurans]RDS86484.1 hypothetical protein DWU99_04395 [Dyella psychrodurans]